MEVAADVQTVYALLNRDGRVVMTGNWGWLLGEVGLPCGSVLNRSLVEMFGPQVGARMTGRMSDVLATGLSMTYAQDFIIRGERYHGIVRIIPLENVHGTTAAALWRVELEPVPSPTQSGTYSFVGHEG